MQELRATYADVSFLNAELRAILASAATLERDADAAAACVDRHVGVVVDLFIDRHKLNARSVTHRVPQLVKLLQEEYTLDGLIDFFNAPL